MNSAKPSIHLALVAICLALLAGCGKSGDKSVDASKPISEVKTEAESMDVQGLRATAMKYRDAILGKQDQFKALTAKLKAIPLTEILGDDANKLKAELEDLTKALSALQQRFKVYYDKLKAEKGNLSGLDL